MPYITVEAHVDLDDFDTEDLIEELERRGGQPVTGTGIDLHRIAHLLTCGQVEQAKQEGWAMLLEAARGCE